MVRIRIVLRKQVIPIPVHCDSVLGFPDAVEM
jgi:hypothetical protein